MGIDREPSGNFLDPKEAERYQWFKKFIAKLTPEERERLNNLTEEDIALAKARYRALNFLGNIFEELEEEGQEEEGARGRMFGIGLSQALSDYRNLKPQLLDENLLDVILEARFAQEGDRRLAGFVLRQVIGNQQQER